MIYHIASNDDWESAAVTDNFIAPSLAGAGFIHCSTLDQVLSVANSLFVGQTDLLLLCIDESKLTAKLKWEAPAHSLQGPAPETRRGEQFPHVYGSVNVAAVVAAVGFNEGDDGFELPSNLPS